MFYLLSLITGILECGWVAYGVVNSFPLWKILCYPLAYHIGNLFPKPFSLNRRILLVTLAVPLITDGLIFFRQLSEEAEFVLSCVSLFILSTVIQSVRSSLKSNGNRLMKRIFRVGGFALAPIAVAVPSVTLILATAVAFCGLKDYNGSSGVSCMKGQNGYSAVMLFHQLHYFFYAHITLAAVSIALSGSSCFGPVYAALLFCGTWITYMSVEPIMSKLTSEVTAVFYAGHIGISVLLFVMHFVTSMPLFIVLWFITGFGGGVVYTISAKAVADVSYHKDSMTISENIGHTLGLLVAVCISAVNGNSSPRIMLASASVSALLAVISMGYISRKEHYHENIRG